MKKRKHEHMDGPVEIQSAKEKKNHNEEKKNHNEEKKNHNEEKKNHNEEKQNHNEDKKKLQETKSPSPFLPTPSVQDRLFFSKSKDTALRRLSNFHLLDPKQSLVITKAALEETKIPIYEGHFASIEHFYQGLKFHYLTGSESTKARGRDMARKFLIDGEYGRDARMAKSKGGKGAMKTNGFYLDSVAWNGIQNKVMIMAIRARALIDTVYAAALKQSAQQQWLWLHFDRAGIRSYWGGHVSKETGQWVGRNRLGELMQKVGRELL
jgi:hypothetical protein